MIAALDDARTGAPSPNWSPPAPELLERVFRFLDPFRALARPEFHGMENVPSERPLLFVGNHSLYGIFDIPFFYERLYLDHGIFLRGLGDHMHFHVPFWREFVTTMGVVHGTREGCAELMNCGSCVLVFPGGSREVTRRRHERHQLIWKERVGFARMAIRHRCTIVPFSAVGVDDCFELLADADDMLKSPLGPLIERFGIRHDALFPVPRSFHAERVYFKVGSPVRTDHYDGRDDEDSCWAVRRQVADAVEDGIRFLLSRREADPERYTGSLVRRELGATVRSAWQDLVRAVQGRL